MLKLNLFILFLILCTGLFCQIKSEKNLDNTRKLIISLSSFHNAKSEDALAIAEILANHIKKSRKLSYQFNVETPNTLDEIEKSTGDDFDCIILTTDEYIALHEKLPLEPLATNFTDGKVGYKFHLIVNKADNISDISQLKNETIHILSRDNQNTPLYWLNKLLADKKLGMYKKFFKNILTDYKATNVLLPVFFKKSKACIITDVALNLMIELNPSIKNSINILSSSDYYLLGMCCLNKKNKNTEAYNTLSDIIFTLDEDEYGRQLLHLFSAEKLVPFKEEYLQNYLKLNK
jgi:ABC-type phosphate/phosphonate transport system substrate-binding protein